MGTTPPRLDLVQTLAGNLVALRARWPQLAKCLEEAVPPAYEHVYPGNESPGSGTLRASGLQLSSAHDREAEAKVQARRIPDGASGATVYGFGMGDLARELLRRSDLQSLRLVIMNPGIAKLGLAFSDNLDWLSDPRLELLLGEHEGQLSEPFVVVPPSLQLANDACLQLRDVLTLMLQQDFISEDLNDRRELWDEHIAQNEDLVARDGDVVTHFGRAQGSRVFVVGPGPSLAGQISVLQENRDSGLLVAISTALPLLLEAGLVPDYVVMIDYLSWPAATGDELAMVRDVPLVYAAEVQGSTLAAWPGPRLACYLDRPRYAALATRIPRGVLWTNGTVAHSAVDLAVRLGAREVLLFGLDFSYPDGTSHSSGAQDHVVHLGGDAGRTLLNGLGRRVASDMNLIQYLRDLEDYIRRTPQVTFARADQRTAAMEGVQWLTT